MKIHRPAQRVLRQVVVVLSLLSVTACKPGRPEPSHDPDATPGEGGLPEGSAGLDAGTNGAVPGPEPNDCATELDPSVATSLFDAVEFLFAGDCTIQTGVDEGVLTAVDVAVVRGRVLDREGSPLAGVRVSVVNHPELGKTLTQADGGYDLAVQGRRALTLRFEAEGHLPVDRSATAPRRGYLVLDDVVLTAQDARVTQVGFTSNSATQVARATLTEDDDGARRASLVVPAGVRADMVLADGTMMPLSEAGIRITEYTVGRAGPAAMPAELPGPTGYTYAVELSADEATTAGADSVRFDQPLAYYVENFLGFPNGSTVPVGYYDRAQQRWLPEPNGRVVQVVSIADGRAVLDTDGDGEPDDADTLSGLGIDDAELERVASLYERGQSLWRVPITHFSTYDFNWALSELLEAGIETLDLLEADPRSDCATEVAGSIIECENRTLGQRASVAGTPFTLNYRSDRAPGRSASRSFTVPLTGEEVSEGLVRIELEIQVAGQVTRRSFDPEPGLSHRFEWDGLDAYDRPIQGAVTAHVSIDYLYDATYALAPSLDRSFGQRGDTNSGVDSREPVRVRRTAELTLRPWDGLGLGLGGFSLDVHHQYDPNGKVLYLGDGRRRGGEGADQQVAEVVTRLRAPTEFDGHELDVIDLALAPEGTLFVLVTVFDDENAGGEVYVNRGLLYRVDGDDVQVVAGCLTCTETGDGGLATDAFLDEPNALALGRDGELYIAERLRLRRVSPGGRIETIACNGQEGDALDDNPLREGRPAKTGACTPRGVAVGPEGRVVFGDSARSSSRDGRLLAVGADGRARTVANLDFDSPVRVRLGQDGAFYVAEFNGGVWRVTGEGDDTRLSAGCCDDYPGDGTPATEAFLDPHDVLPVANGSVLVASGHDVVYRIDPDGRTSTYAGSGELGFEGAGFARSTPLFQPSSLVMGPNGTTYVAAELSSAVFRIRDQLPGFDDDVLLIASQDGSELYEFSSRGRHLRTLDAYTGEDRWLFAYTAAGALDEIQDAFGNVTRIERSPEGRPTAIVAPFGQRTTFATDAGGRLSSLTDPAGSQTQARYTDGGLMTSWVDPKGGTHRFEYDDDGLLTRDEAPNPEQNGHQSLSESGPGRDRMVTLQTAEGRTTEFHIERDSWETTHTVTDAAGLETRSVQIYGEGTFVQRPDGTEVRSTIAVDPRWLGQAPFVREQRTLLPSGLERVVTREVTAELEDESDALSLQTLTTQVALNGQAWTTARNVAEQELRIHSPEGRESVLGMDDHGRVTSVQRPGLAQWSMAYDERGRLVTLRAEAGDATRQLQVRYGSDGYAASTTVEGADTAYTRDPVGRLLSVTNPAEETVRFAYNAAGELTSLTPPSQPQHQFRHSSQGLETAYIAPAVTASPSTTRYAHDRDGLVTQVRFPDGRTLDLGRLPDGRPQTIDVGLATPYQLSYSPSTGQAQTLDAPGGISLELEYDGPFVASAAWTVDETAFGRVDVARDDAFQIAERTVNDVQTVPYGYDEDGLVVQAGPLEITRDDDSGVAHFADLDLLHTELQHNAFGELASIETHYDGDVLHRERIVERDAAGRILEVEQTIEAETSITTYAYDRAGRLTSVSHDGELARQYSYDANGNRTRRTVGGTTEEASYDAQDRIESAATRRYTFNANGQLTALTDSATDETSRFDYDLFGNLRSVDLPDGTRVDYEIDALQRRVGKRVDGATVYRLIYQDALRPIAMIDGDGALTATFVYVGDRHVPDVMIRDDGTYRLVSDHLGSVRLVVDAADGTIAQRIDYDEFGNVLLDTNPGFQPFGFAGGLYDPLTGLVRFGARDYDAETGRWTAKDPIRFAGGDTNLYAYVGNDPVNLIDPSGLFAPLISGGIGALVGGALGAGVAIATNQSVAAGALTGALTGFGVGSGAALLGGLATAGSGVLLSGVGGSLGGFFGNAVGQGISVGAGFQENPSALGLGLAGVFGGLGGAGGAAIARDLSQSVGVAEGFATFCGDAISSTVAGAAETAGNVSR